MGIRAVDKILTIQYSMSPQIPPTPHTPAEMRDEDESVSDTNYIAWL